MTKQPSQGERIAIVESRMDHMEEDVTAIKADVREIRDALLKGKGGWKLAVTLFALAGVVVTGIISAWAIKWFGFNTAK